MITMVYWLWFICCVNSGDHYQTCVSRLLSAVSYCTSSSIHQFNHRIVADVINSSFQFSNYSRFFIYFSSASIFRVMKIKRRRGKESLVFMKFKAKTALPGQSPNHPTPTKVEYHTLHLKSWWSTTVLDSINGVALCHCWSIILSMENK